MMTIEDYRRRISNKQKREWARRKYQGDPEWREKHLAKSRAYYRRVRAKKLAEVNAE